MAGVKPVTNQGCPESAAVCVLLKRDKEKKSFPSPHPFRYHFHRWSTKKNQQPTQTGRPSVVLRITAS